MKVASMAVGSAEWGTFSPVLLTMEPDVPPRYVSQGISGDQMSPLFFISFVSCLYGVSVLGVYS